MMNRIKMLTIHWLKAFLYPRPMIGLFYLPRFFLHWIRYTGASKLQEVSLMDSQPCLGDWTMHTPFDAHYFYQGAWLARCLEQIKPQQHIDVGSSVLTVGVLSGWVKTVFLDYRPLKTCSTGLYSIAGNLLVLPFRDGSLKSLSCLHVIEHIGLGRYGDPLDPQGSVKAAKELQRVLAPGGRLYISLPIGRERTCFNAHRVHHPKNVLRMFSELSLIDFSYIDDNGVFKQHINVPPSCHMEYGCGMFIFEKPIC